MNKIMLDKGKVDELFDSSAHQADVLIGLYKMVYSNWGKIAKVNGFPTSSRETAEYLMGRFIAFDKKHHPDVLNGGLWMNNGFSSLEGDGLDFLEVEPAPISLT